MATTPLVILQHPPTSEVISQSSYTGPLSPTAAAASAASSSSALEPAVEETQQSVGEAKKPALQASNSQPLASSSSSGTQPLTEAERLAGVFKTIDTWAGISSLKMLTSTYTAEQSYMGRDVSKEFYHILFDGDDDKLPFRMDTVLAMHSTLTKASDSYHRYKFLVDFLEAGRGKEPVQAFIEAIKTIPQWQIPSNEEFKNAWYTLWYILGFPTDTDRQAGSFQEQIHKIFPPVSQKIQASTSFLISLADLDSVDLRVKPTENLREHLLIEGNAVNIYSVEFNDLDMLHKYENNRAAKALGIASLGSEIIASLYALYVKDKFFDRAEALKIFLPKNDWHRPVMVKSLSMKYVEANPKSIIVKALSLKYVEANPKVLAHRAYTLQRLVNYRRSWWPSIVRDVKKQLQVQPVLFYGALLAMFFGVCTVIQTVASVWALLLAIRAA